MPHCDKVELGSGWVEVASVIRRPARHWKRWLSAAHSGILHTTPTPAAVEAWNLTHYTYTCRGPKAAHRAVEFYTEALPTPLCSCFSPCCFGRKTNKQKKAFCSHASRIHDPQTFATCLCDDISTDDLCLFLHVNSNVFCKEMFIRSLFFWHHSFIYLLHKEPKSWCHITSLCSTSLCNCFCVWFKLGYTCTHTKHGWGQNKEEEKGEGSM